MASADVIDQGTGSKTTCPRAEVTFTTPLQVAEEGIAKLNPMFSGQFASVLKEALERQGGSGSLYDGPIQTEAPRQERCAPAGSRVWHPDVGYTPESRIGVPSIPGRSLSSWKLSRNVGNVVAGSTVNSQAVCTDHVSFERGRAALIDSMCGTACIVDM